MTLTTAAKRAIESILSRGGRAEVSVNKDGVKVVEIKRTVVKL